MLNPDKMYCSISSIQQISVYLSYMYICSTFCRSSVEAIPGHIAELCMNFPPDHNHVTSSNKT